MHKILFEYLNFSLKILFMISTNELYGIDCSSDLFAFSKMYAISTKMCENRIFFFNLSNFCFKKFISCYIKLSITEMDFFFELENPLIRKKIVLSAPEAPPSPMLKTRNGKLFVTF